MQQRRPRLGDILDDYCPRERRITNHAVVAMIEDDVRQTRCTTCDAEHEYKQARVPASRRKKGADPLSALASAEAPPTAAPLFADDGEELALDEVSPALEASPEEAPAADDEHAGDDEQDDSRGIDDDGPVHRPLIRATLPRPEGQVPERKAPDFTMRQPNRFDGRNGARGRGRGAGGRQAGPSFGQGGTSRPGSGARQGSGQPGQGDASRGFRNGNRGGNAGNAGNAPGGRGGRPAGTDRGGRPGGQGRKRGR
jgi:hypothetical protein